MIRMQNKMPIRIVVDTNVWISLLIGRNLGGILAILDSPKVELIGTKRLFLEVAAVTQREKFSKYFSKKDVRQLMQWMETEMTTIELPVEIPKRCRDPKDDYLIELAIRSKAVFLVSGDDDLLSIGEIEGCRIMTVRQFENEFFSHYTA